MTINKFWPNSAISYTYSEDSGGSLSVMKIQFVRITIIMNVLKILEKH